MRVHMNRFLERTVYGCYATIAALLAVRVYDIASPLSLAIVALGVFADVQRLVLPADWARDRFPRLVESPLTHPNLPLAVAAAIAAALFVLAVTVPGLCLPWFTAFFDGLVGAAPWQLQRHGGACAVPYGTIAYALVILFPLLTMMSAAHSKFVYHMDRNLMIKRNRFKIGIGIDRNHKPASVWVGSIVLVVLVCVAAIPFTGEGRIINVNLPEHSFDLGIALILLGYSPKLFSEVSHAKTVRSLEEREQ